MRPYNIVWTVVDSVRHYHTDGDDRGRLKIMDEFAEQAVEFRKVVTSAPSTVMSISAMMTSLPAYYLGRNYTDFRFDNEYFTTFSSILNKAGYTTRALIMHRDIREKLRVFDLIPRKYWPPGYSHRDWWDNAKINRLLHNAIAMDGTDLPRPVFWFLDFNCRKDPKTSDYVKDSLAALEAAGYTRDNTIYILCSDHGYPDPARGITPEELKRKNMTHDIFMTDDNLLIPLLIRYPGCQQGQQIETTVSSLDIMPTLLDLLEIDAPENVRKRWQGKSLLPLLHDEHTGGNQGRKLRTDARFMGQSGRVSALRDDAFKYVYHHDDGREEFFDVSVFTLDEIDISTRDDARVQRALLDFRGAFRESEAQGVAFQIDYATHRLGKQMAKIKKPGRVSPLRILVLSTAGNTFLHSLGVALRKVEPDAEISLVAPAGMFKDDTEKASFDRVLMFVGKMDLRVDMATRAQLDAARYDLAILIYDSAAKSDFEGLWAFAGGIKSSKQVMMDLNMSISVRKGQVHRYLRTIWANRLFFRQEPSLVFFEIWKIARTLYLHTKLKVLGVH